MRDRLNLMTPLGFTVLMLQARMTKARREDGASAVEWVIIAGLLLIICGVVGGLLKSALTNKATSVGNDIQK